MNFKKNLKRFMTLNRHHAEGFTLVELIVVIAILAILGGVAVPAYSGYVEKARTAADEQLLAALNTAFSSACAINGENHYNRKDVTVQMIDEEDGKRAKITVADIGDSFETAFNGFYEGGTFKVFTELFYNRSEGRISNNAIMTFYINGIPVSLSAKDVAILSGDNAFSNRGSAALLNDVGVLENLLDTGIGEDVLNDVANSPEFLAALNSYLGLNPDDFESTEEYEAALEAKLAANENAIYSAQIMFAASNAANTSDEDIAKLFNGEGAVTSKIEVKNADGTTDSNATMANAALAYGMYTAYLERNPDIDPNSNAGNFTNVVNSTEFAEYMASEEGATDLEAYQAAMNMISDNSGNSEITGSIIENGVVGNDDLAGLMQEVMGN